MLIEINALRNELPALNGMAVIKLCEQLASLGFPVDGVEASGPATVLEVDITANRGDAQSHRGMARDLAAKLGAELSPLPHRLQPDRHQRFPFGQGRVAQGAQLRPQLGRQVPGQAAVGLGVAPVGGDIHLQHRGLPLRLHPVHREPQTCQ